MAEQFGERTHDATPHRRQQARDEGQVARSQDLSSALLLIISLGILMYWGGDVADWFGRLAHAQLGGEAWTVMDRDTAVALYVGVASQLARLLLPIFGLLMLAAIAVNVGQTGLLFLPNKLALDFSRLSLLKGVQRLAAPANAMRLAFGIVKIIIVTAVAAWAVWGQRETVVALGGMDVPRIAVFLIDTTLWTCMKIGAALLILAILDYAYQWWKHEQDLKMTHQELREEMKSQQGDPQLLARRRAVQRQLVMSRVNSAVPTADVVVTNPTELAIAIRYDPEQMEAPTVVAKGAGVLAARIRRLALENNVPIVERKELARTLYKEVEINQQIPAEQYATVAEVLRYVYQLKGKTL